MKKPLILFSLLGLSLVSCKKEYTCDCTITGNDQSSGAQVVFAKNTSVAYGKKMTKKQAKSACDHEAESVNSNLESLINGSGSQSPSQYFTVNCDLK